MTTTETIVGELQGQAAFLRLREPVYERALALLVDAVRGDFGVRLQSLWAGRAFNAVYERPLLLLAALRYDALCEGPTHPLYRAVAANAVQIDALTPDAFADAISPARSRFEQVLARRAVQTNETTRAVTWLWPAYLLASLGERRSLALVDLGTSAGLNLIADELPPLWVDERNDPIPIAPRPPVALRLGLDVAPLDVRQRDDALWLRACVWPSDRERMERLERGIERFTSSAGRPDAPVLEACALPNAGPRLESLPHDRFVLCVQTIVRDYLTPAEQEQYEEAKRQFLLNRPPRSALIVELEVDLANLAQSGRSGMIAVRFADAGGVLRELLLARTHPHPRQLFLEHEAIGAFRRAFQAVGAP